MAGTLRLTLLGWLHITRDETEVEGFVSRKAQALLAYLAVSGRVHFRDALAGLLWGTASQKRAAGNLRVVLSNLRHLVPDHIVITRQTVEFNRESDYWLDVEEFEKLVNWESSRLVNRESGRLVDWETIGLPALRKAVNLYQGDFLEGFYVRDAPAFEEWVLLERERLRQMALQALHCLVEYHTARGEYATAIDYATRLLALDPWREEAHRELMLLLALTGQRGAALAQYEKCRHLLAEELGLEPLEETMALYRRLVDWESGRLQYLNLPPLQPSSLPVSQPSSLPTSQPSNLPFVGRGDEHAQLVAWWERARQGEGGLTLIEGEAGMGKTRLVEEVARYAEAQGAVVLRGRCYEFGGSLPYQPIAEALRGYLCDRGIRRQGDKETRRQGDREIGRQGDRGIGRQGDREIGRQGDRGIGRQGDREIGRQGDREIRRDYPYPTTSPPHLVTLSPPHSVTLPPPHLDSLPPVWLAELSRLLPEVHQMYPDLPNPIRISGEEARQRLFEAVAQFILAIADNRAATCNRQSVVLFLDDLHWADQSTLDLLHYLVRRLSDAPVWIVGTYRPEEVSLSHPLIRLRQGLSRDHLVHHLVLRPLMPEAVEEIARSLVGKEKAASLGVFLYRESEGNPFMLVEMISSLREQGALRGGQAGHWRWVKPPTAATMPVSVRDVVLQRVGRLSEPAQRLLMLAAVIGRQFDIPLLRAAAGPDAEAVDGSLDEWLSRRLVRQLSTSHPTSHVLRFTPHASRFIPHGSLFDFTHDKIRAVLYHATEAWQRRTLHRRVGEALEKLYAGHLEEVYEQLAHHYEQAGVADRALVYLPLAAAQAAAVYANREALDYYDRALALLGEDDHRRWEILLQRGKVLRFIGRYQEAITACRQVVEKAQGTPEGRLLAARAANELSEACRARRDYDQARAWAQEAHRLTGEVEERAEAGYQHMENCASGGRKICQPETRFLAESGFLHRTDRSRNAQGRNFPATDYLREQARAKHALGEVEREQGNLEAARGLFQEGLALYRTLEDRRGMAECLNGLGNVLSSQGAYDAARQRFEEALTIFQALGDRQSEAACLRTIGITYWRQGANDAAHRAFMESMNICRAIGDRQGKAASLNGLGLVYIVQGAYDETRRCWEESAALFRALGLEKRAASCLHNLGILHMSQGDYTVAQQYLEESLAINRSTGAKSAETLDMGWLGNLHFSRGEYDDARRCLEMVLTLDREIGGSEEEVWHLSLLGAVAYETGDMAEAESYFREAIQLARERGATLGLHEVYRRLAAVHLVQGDGEAALAAARQAMAEAEAGDDEKAIGSCYLILGTVYGSGLIEKAENPVPYFRRALKLLADGNPFWYGVALRRYGAYLLHSGDREQGQAHLREAQAVFGRLGARGELDKVTRLLDGDETPQLRW